MTPRAPWKPTIAALLERKRAINDAVPRSVESALGDLDGSELAALLALAGAR
ncbi:hypothetical protein AB0D12_23830 [Streptomyces sp. NPDC048479]|uniref:hypothetical protein n=1 Tax=Streptomyces sp. NPDC048479 TaxID=3154725 RepID=UPI00342E0671